MDTVSNDEVARIFLDMAEALEVAGNERFRVRAYENAARTILQLDEPLRDIRARGALRSLPGIGEGLAGKIEEILDSGHLRAHDEMLRQVPPAMLALLSVPGIGPRSAEALYRQLGISNEEELAQAAREGRIRALHGFGAKTEANILRNIERKQRRGTRVPLARAYPLAQQVVRLLRQEAPLEQIAVAGSLRRMQEDVGDIDVLVTSADPRQVMEAVTRLPMVERVLLAGPTKTSVETKLGLQLDVRVVEPESFGAALQYFTGSRAHNIKLRTLAVRLGYKLSEYGIYRAESGERLGGSTEEEVYDTLGIRMFPPELREDRGEIELGLQGTLPEFIQEDDILGDLHAHTNWSDGRASLREMALAAAERGMQYLAITDHSSGRANARGLSVERLRQQLSEIKALNAQHSGITLLAGAEVDIRRDGTLDFPDAVLAELDLCVASIHAAFDLSEEEQTARLLQAMRHPYVDIIGHPSGRVLGSRDPLHLDMRRVLLEAARSGVALEVNCWPERLDLNDQYILLARGLGAPLVIDTDAHAPEHFANLFFGVATARRGWATPRDILNTMPLPLFLARLRRHTLRKAA